MHWIKTLVGLLLLLLISSQLVYAAPFTPKDDQQILATLPDELSLSLKQPESAADPVINTANST